MDLLTEELSQDLLNTEWLVKVDPNKSIPYLMKYHVSMNDLSSCILITDTKSVWVEVLNRKQLARRWRACNPQSPEQFSDTSDEDAWRKGVVNLLSNGHTMGGMLEMSFEEAESNYSDLSFELECGAFKWRWETYFVGYRQSSEILSKHLIFPLISLNHLTFSSSHSISELSDGDLEQSIGKLGQTARRATANHIKTALSVPRVTTSIRRMTATFNFIPATDLKPITSIADKPLLEIDRLVANDDVFQRPPSPPPRQQEPDSPPRREKSSPKKTTQEKERSMAIEPAKSDSETESDDEPTETKKTFGTINPAGPSKTSEKSGSVSLSKIPTPPLPIPPRKSRSHSGSDSEVSAPRPVKKAKPAVQSSGDDDSDQEAKKSRSGSTAASGARRGTRQPIKRGGKRF